MQMSMRKLNSHTILQNYPLWCCCHVMYKLRILALGSGQRLLYRLGSGSGLVLVLVLRCNAIAHTVLHVSPRENNTIFSYASDALCLTAIKFVQCINCTFSAEFCRSTDCKG